MKRFFDKFIRAVLIIIWTGINPLIAQEKIEGYLLNKDTGEPVAFATLHVKGKVTSGTVSNEDGFFLLGLQGITETDTLLISHINYVPQALLVRSLRGLAEVKILLTENVVQLSEVQVKASEDYQVFDDAVKSTIQKVQFPMTANLYYREMVKENKSFSKFADALLTVVYDKNGKENTIKTRVDQCRTRKLPKEDDAQLEMLSPIKLEKVLEYQFVGFLSRFQNENRANYHFYFMDSDRVGGEKFIIIEPKQGVDRSNDKLFFRALVKLNHDKTIKEAVIEMDSLCQVEKSVLGIQVTLVKSKVSLTFAEVNGVYGLTFARFNAVLIVTMKGTIQTEYFTSEFVATDMRQGAREIAKSDLYKKSILFKHPDKYESPFWREINLPVFTKEEERLISELEKNSKKE